MVLARADIKRIGDVDGKKATAVVQIDADGVAIGANLFDYKISDIDADASPNYYGFERADGAWYILKETISAGADTYRYIKGTTDLSTNWGNRTTLTYDTFVNTF